MLDDNHRLSFSIDVNAHSLIIFDNITQMCCVIKRNVLMMDSVPHDLIILHMQNIQERLALLSKFPKHIKNKEVVSELQILETDHFSWEFKYGAELCILNENEYKCTRKFDMMKIQEALSSVYCALESSYAMTNPLTDIVRIIPEYDLLVIHYREHKLVTNSSTRFGRILYNCIFDNELYEVLYILPRVKLNSMWIVSKGAHVVACLPIDTSVVKIFGKGEDIL